MNIIEMVILTGCLVVIAAGLTWVFLFHYPMDEKKKAIWMEAIIAFFILLVTFFSVF